MSVEGLKRDGILTILRLYYAFYFEAGFFQFFLAKFIAYTFSSKKLSKDQKRKVVDTVLGNISIKPEQFSFLTNEHQIDIDNPPIALDPAQLAQAGFSPLIPDSKHHRYWKHVQIIPNEICIYVGINADPETALAYTKKEAERSVQENQKAISERRLEQRLHPDNPALFTNRERDRDDSGDPPGR